MTENQMGVALLNNNRRQFEQTLTRALRSRGNLLILAHCADQLRLQVVEKRAQDLVSGSNVVTDIERGRALWELLREAIDRLRPTASTPEHTPSWRFYAIAEGIYVQGKSAREMTAELGISSRTFHRERRAAVEALATVVWQVEQQMTSLSNVIVKPVNHPEAHSHRQEAP